MRPTLIDTHCHIHEILGPAQGEYAVANKWHKAGITDIKEVIAAAHAVGVQQMLCIGCTVDDSALAVDLAQREERVHAVIGMHPHEARHYLNNQAELDRFAALASQPKVVGIGECGLDYFYEHSDREDQIPILEFQLELAEKHNLPMVFHVREAFADFWPIFDKYPGIRGVIHSFSASEQDVQEIVKRGLYIGLNGIMTFTSDQRQLTAARAVPLENLLLETDAPFLTPNPYRGTICQPKHVAVTAAFLAELRGEPLEILAQATTANAQQLFGLS